LGSLLHANVLQSDIRANAGTQFAARKSGNGTRFAPLLGGTNRADGLLNAAPEFMPYVKRNFG